MPKCSMYIGCLSPAVCSRLKTCPEDTRNAATVDHLIKVLGEPQKPSSEAPSTLCVDDKPCIMDTCAKDGCVVHNTRGVPFNRDKPKRPDLDLSPYQPDNSYLGEILKLARVILRETEMDPKSPLLRMGYSLHTIKADTRDKLKHAVDMYDIGKD